MKVDYFIFMELVRLLFTTDFSYRAIGEILDLAHTTVIRYVKKIDCCGMSEKELFALTAKQYKEKFHRRKPHNTGKRIPDYALHVENLKKKGETKKRQWKLYWDIDPETAYSRTQFNHHLNRYLKRHKKSYRGRHYPGHIVQVDYAGTTINTLELALNDGTKAQIFVASMDKSQKIFMYACRSQKIPEWIDACRLMFEYYGGVPDILICDNLPAAVTSKGKKRVLTRTFAEFGRHYKCEIMPTKVRHPQGKPLGELVAKYFKYIIYPNLRDKVFGTMNELNEALAIEVEAFNNQIQDCGTSRHQRFEAEDSSELHSLPATPYICSTWIPEKVVPDNCYLEVEGHDYSVHHLYRNKKIETRYNNYVVEFYGDGELVSSHKRSFIKGDFTTNLNDLEKEDRELGYCKADYLSWAYPIDQSVVEIVNKHFENRKEYDQFARRCLSNIKRIWSDTEDLEEFIDACRWAIKEKRYDMSSIKDFMRFKPWQTDISEDYQFPVHSNIRGSDYYKNGGLRNV